MEISKPVALQLAKASWISVLLVSAVSYFTRGATPGYEGIVGLIVLVVSVVLLLVSLISGILALRAARRFGAPGLLVPAVVGLALSAGLLAVIANGVASALGPEPVDQRMTKLADVLGKDLPKMVSTDIELTSAQAAGAELILLFTLPHRNADQVNVAAFQAGIGPVIREGACTKFGIRWTDGARSRVIYKSADGVSIAEVVVTEEDCKSRAGT